MDDFLRRCREEYRVGSAQNEKEWLRTFYYDVEKCIRQNESDAEFADVCLSVLHQIKELRSGADRNECSDWLPVSQQVVPLDTLFRTSKDVFGGSLGCSLTEEECMMPGFKLASKIPFILLGYLTLQPKSAKSSKATGTLYIEDNFAAVVCEIINPNKDDLEKLLLIPEWNYVPVSSLSSAKSPKKDLKNSHGGYIEIINACTPVVTTKTDPPANNNFLHDVYTIKEFQQLRSSPANLDICGNIFALSPIHSMSVGKPFFLVKLSCPETSLTTSVVIQGEQFMLWHNFLQIDEQYVFQGLRETTMNKGTRNERKILATTRRSKLQRYQLGIPVRRSRSVKRPHEDEQRESKRPKKSEGQDELPNHGRIPNYNADVTSTTAPDETTILQPAKPRLPVNMTYTGVITKCIKPEAGLFELDNKIRLYISHQPSVNLGRGLRVGAHVTAHNVHLCKKGKKTLGLCCCTQSTVRVVTFSSLASSWKPFSPCESPLALLGQNLTLPDYVDLLEMCEKVLDKFSPLYRTSQLVAYSAKQTRKKDTDSKNWSVLESLLSFVKRNSAPANVPSRNIYDEFFETPHECHPNHANLLTFPWLPTIKEFVDAVSQLSCNKPWLSGLPSKTSTVTQEKEDWMYKILSQECFSQPLILVGCLGSSPKAGQLRLLDQTGEINCVITRGDEQSTEHDCAKHCCEESSNNEHYSRCPYAQIWNLNAMIQINRFEVVMEKFQSRSLIQEDFDGDGNRMYLQFSFDDSKILILKDKTRVKRYFWKEDKSEADTKNASLYKELNGSLEKKSDWFICSVVFMVRNCEVALLRRIKEELCYPCGVEIKIVAVYRNDFQETSVNNSKSSERVVPSSSTMPRFLSVFKLEAKNAALKLEKKSLGLAHFLHPGCFYVITETVPDEKHSRILQNGELEVLISVSSDMLLERICWCESCGLESSTATGNNSDISKVLDELKNDFLKNDKLLSVDTVLSDSTCNKSGNEKSLPQSCSSSTQVSLRGLIVSRELRQSDSPSQRLPNELVEVPKFGPVKISAIKALQLGLTVLKNTIIHLRVRDLESPNTISVYLDFRRTTYIGGILPGAIVQFRRLVRKLSRTRNMYCTFEACSSIFVERRAATNFTGVQTNPHNSVNVAPSTSGEGNTKELPNQYLIGLIQSEAQGKFVQTISRVRCRVTAVQKASLRWLCKRCGELVTRNECTAGCYSPLGFKLNAEARCVVEDGTGEAQLYVYDDLVPTLLKLSGQQWRNLQDLAMRTGELFYQRHWYGGNSRHKVNEGNLSSRETEAKLTWESHCCSSPVPRRIVLQCKLFRFKKGGADNTEQGYESRSITVGSTEHSTLVLPKLLLRAVSITELRAVEEIRQLFQEGRDGQPMWEN